MRRIRMVVPVFAVVALFVLASAPIFAAEPTAAEPAEVAPPTPGAQTVESACPPDAASLDLLVAPDAPMCSAQSAEVDGIDDLEWLQARPPQRPKTCWCSCGAPCQTDADCGSGGLCRVGVTCC